MFCPNKEMLCDAHFFDRPAPERKVHRHRPLSGGAAGGPRRVPYPLGHLALELLETGETLSVATMEPHGVRADRAAFDAAGERLLSAPAGRRSLLLMDELGFLERCSPVFQRAVFTLLDGPEKSPFWGPVSRRADVRLLPLTVENRAEIPTELARLLG